MQRILYILILFVGLDLSAQHVPVISQYQFNGLALNPAYTGSEDALSILTSYRSQWTGLDGAPETQTLACHMPLNGEHSAVGIQLFRDQIGVDKNTGVYMSYAYRLQFYRAKLSLGIQGGVSMLRSNFSQLNVRDAGDVQFMQDSPLGVLPNFSLGAHFYTRTYFISFSLPFFMSHEFNNMEYSVSHDFSNHNYMLGGGMEFEMNRKLKLKPSMLFKYHYAAPVQVDINLMAQLNKSLDVGISFRTQEAVIANVEYRFNERLSAAFNYEHQISDLATYTHGSQGLGLKYTFIDLAKTQGPRFLGW